jgi:polyferredoxin
MARRPHLRVDTLAARVRWLDRYRRAVAITAAGAFAPYLMSKLGHELGSEWPQFHITLLSLMLGVVVWMLVEVGLVYVTALWETEQYRLTRDRGLPRAIWLRSGRWRSF